MALHIPFLSRLHIWEYFSLMLSVLLIALESLIAVITIALPTPIINVCYRITRSIWNKLSSPTSRRNRQKKKAVWSAIANASDFTELCDLYGYYAEEHIVQTGDGYLLGLHRLGYRRGEEDVRVNAGPGKGGVKKKVVYMHHGLMMNSEVWVCLSEKERCLPFELVDRGYDVWVSFVSYVLTVMLSADNHVAWQQSRKQVLEEVRPHRSDLNCLLELQHGPVRLPRHP
jgi:lysosomal acid lipase/cholesteryl ester hydrolase